MMVTAPCSKQVDSGISDESGGPLPPNCTRAAGDRAAVASNNYAADDVPRSWATTPT